MKTICCLFILITIAIADACHAAIINLSTAGVTTSISLGYSSTIFGDTRYNSTSPPQDLTVTVDDVADTATFLAPELSVVTDEFSRTSERTYTTVTPPTNFPDPPIITRTRLVESITINPASLEFQFVSSSTGALSYFSPALSYQFRSNVRLMFPSSFTLSGTYQVQGPTETVTMPFSIPFHRTGSDTLNGLWIGFIRPGSNYPETAVMGAIDIFQFYPTYRPAPTTIFQGTVDGIPVTARLFDAFTSVRLPMPVPESTSNVLLVFSLAMLAVPLVRRCNRVKVAFAGKP
jgi:hypothetical protein